MPMAIDDEPRFGRKVCFLEMPFVFHHGMGLSVFICSQPCSYAHEVFDLHALRYETVPCLRLLV